MSIFTFEQVPDVIIESGRAGSISIKRFGKLFVLCENDLPWMYYTPSTKRAACEQFTSWDLAHGNALLTGFGFGVTLNWLAQKPEVTSITVLEKSKEVVELYLRNNKLPDNKPITILHEDANVYTDLKHYECLFIDHLDHEPDMVATARSIGLNIKHDVMWFWPLELIYANKAYKIPLLSDYFIYRDKYPRVDFGEKWAEFRKSLDIPTVPKLSPQQISYYVKVYANYLTESE